MLSMILRMSAVTFAYVIVNYIIWYRTKGKKITTSGKIIIGIIYGICAILSTHFGIDYEHMMLNVRDIAPLSAGLFFDPVSGIIAGLVGGIERFIAGTYWGVGSYTRIACSLSTCLAGILAALLHIYVFKKKKPTAFYSFFIGSTMEVFHMYVVFITHRDDMDKAFYVVKICAVPMIIFTGIGLALSSLLFIIKAGEWHNPFRKYAPSDIRVSHKFQFWLFLVTLLVLSFNYGLGYLLNTNSAEQSAGNTLTYAINNIEEHYNTYRKNNSDITELSFIVGKTGGYEIYDDTGRIISGTHIGESLNNRDILDTAIDNTRNISLFGDDLTVKVKELSDGNHLLTWITTEEVYAQRNSQNYETMLADILLFTVIYVLISMLVQSIVVRDLDMVNESLNRITDGNLDEVVKVYTSSEFTSLSDDINQTVSVLKGYIEAAEKRMEHELELANTIQESALPHFFTFPGYNFEIYASMDPAKEVGGDFYDFFLIDKNKLCMVIADVSGKGIPAALFMMRSKTAIRSYAEMGEPPSVIFENTNNNLCEGNDAEMFVTAWIGILDLTTGHMVCANAGHEYPAIKKADGEYELVKRKHSVALAVMEGMSFAEYELDLMPGDSIFVYTDGVPEATDENEKQYGTERMINVLNAVKDEPQEGILKTMRQDLFAYMDKVDQFDDITMLGLKYTP
ncbi:MAG: SpoIIE family protein phosphatase [Eubacterium sp.]|nr:SpoIIE family protein phosphatase [Eubacterium sp.]